MEKLKIVSEVESRINRILKDRQAELDNLADLISADDTAILESEVAMDNATSAGDLSAYQKAKANRVNAMDGKEMHEKRLAALMKKPLISEAEYKKTIADICAEVAAIDDTAKQKLTALSDQMNSVALDLQAMLRNANSVLSRLQHEIYQDADRTRNPKTDEVIPIESENVCVNQAFFNTVKWGRAGVSSAAYRLYTGREG